MKCPNCGAENREGVKFCGSCGGSLEGAGDDTARQQPAGGQPDRTPKPQWYIHMNGQNHGPYGTRDLAAYIKAGRVPAETPVWKQGMEGWKQASQVKAFAPVAGGGAKAGGGPGGTAAAVAGGAAQPSAAKEQAAEQTEDDKKYDLGARKKYEKAKTRRQRAEERAEAKKKAREEQEARASVQVMRTREGTPTQFYEYPLFILPLLIVTYPLGFFFLWYSRKMGSGSKLFLTILFGVLWGTAVFMVISPNFYTPVSSTNPTDLPTGFSRATFDAIPYFMPEPRVADLLGNASDGCADTKKPVIGMVTDCVWNREYDDGSIVITVYFWQGRMVKKTWEEFDVEGNPIDDSTIVL
mgnify:CR=1 FL=1